MHLILHEENIKDATSVKGATSVLFDSSQSESSVAPRYVFLNCRDGRESEVLTGWSKFPRQNYNYPERPLRFPRRGCRSDGQKTMRGESGRADRAGNRNGTETWKV